MYTLSGLALMALGSGGFWYFLPRDGVVHPLVRKPFFDSFVTIAIMTIVFVGLALIAEAVIG
jgi:hypothetical protein